MQRERKGGKVMRLFKVSDGIKPGDKVAVANNTAVIKGKEASYELIKCGALYYISVRYCNEISSVIVGDNFFEAALVYEKTVKNCVTPVTLSYIVDDFLLEKQNA